MYEFVSEMVRVVQAMEKKPIQLRIFSWIVFIFIFVFSCWCPFRTVNAHVDVWCVYGTHHQPSQHIHNSSQHTESYIIVWHVRQASAADNNTTLRTVGSSVHITIIANITFTVLKTKWNVSMYSHYYVNITLISVFYLYAILSTPAGPSHAFTRVLFVVGLFCEVNCMAENGYPRALHDTLSCSYLAKNINQL